MSPGHMYLCSQSVQERLVGDNRAQTVRMEYNAVIRNRLTVLALGDTLPLLVITLIGFATHGEAGIGFLPRMAAAFFPLTVSWFLLAPWFGLFTAEVVREPRLLWRPALAMLLAGPLAVVLRGLLLNAPIIPIFAVVLSTTSAAALVVWRALYAFSAPRKR